MVEQIAVEPLPGARQLVVVGKSIERVDSLDKVLGKPIYTMDIIPENTLSESGSVECGARQVEASRSV